MRTHAHTWVEAGRQGAYIDHVRVIHGQHRNDVCWAVWVICACGQKGFRRPWSRVVFTCEDWA